MPTENEYSLQDLADLADVSPRTIRYYVAQGLLPSPGQVGPGARYTDGTLARLRLIRRLQREHLPLAEIRTRLAGLDNETIASLVELEAPRPPESSALDYIWVSSGIGHAQRVAAQLQGLVAPASRAILAQLLVRARTVKQLAEPDARPAHGRHTSRSRGPGTPGRPDRHDLHRTDHPALAVGPDRPEPGYRAPRPPAPEPPAERAGRRLSDRPPSSCEEDQS